MTCTHYTALFSRDPANLKENCLHRIRAYLSVRQSFICPSERLSGSRSTYLFVRLP